MNIKAMLRNYLTKGYDKKYARKILSYRITYRDWIRDKEAKDNRREPLPTRSEDTLTFFPADATYWNPNARRAMLQYAYEHEEVMLLYGDEDCVLEQGGAMEPWLKPGWSPDTYLDKPYIRRGFAIRGSLEKAHFTRDIVNEHTQSVDDAALAGFLKVIGGFLPDNHSIVHLDTIAYHCPVPFLEMDKEVKSIDPKELGLLESDCSPSEALVSIIIPSKDNVSVLKQCLKTIQDTVRQQPYEIIIVDNGSIESTKKILEEEIEKSNHDLKENPAQITYLYEPQTFNFAAMCNLGAKQAKGDILLFLNDDIEAVHPGWVEAMAEVAARPWVGAVGMKLLYPDSDRIQHVGITNIPIGPVHKLQFLKDMAVYYDGRNRGIRDVLAVTGACLMVYAKQFCEIGGFLKDLQVAFNDVELCFRLYEKGYHNVVLNDMHLIHHESLSRGNDEAEDKMARLQRERAVLYEHHPLLPGRDPYYHNWLSRKGLDTRIEPDYLNGIWIQDKKKIEPSSVLSKLRRNDCLLVRIEYAGTERIQGYAVVLGSDNACYRKKLLLKPRGENKQMYTIEYTEQYRSDLEENMPDQINVGLSGFDVTLLNTLPDGEYRIGAMARDKISGVTLVNWSNRYLLWHSC